MFVFEYFTRLPNSNKDHQASLIYVYYQLNSIVDVIEVEVAMKYLQFVYIIFVH